MSHDYNFPALNDLAAMINHWAQGMGWHEPGKVREFDGMLANVHGEVSEALEEWRAGREMTETYWKIGPITPEDNLPDIQVKDGKFWVLDYELEAEQSQRGHDDLVWRELTPERLRSMPNLYGKIKPEGIPTELADIIIRTVHIAAYFGIDLAGALADKMVYNEQRAYRHGGKRS